MQVTRFPSTDPDQVIADLAEAVRANLNLFVASLAGAVKEALALYLRLETAALKVATALHLPTDGIKASIASVGQSIGELDDFIVQRTKSAT
jgi:hypothetical protein